MPLSVIDVPALLAPIGENGAGADLRVKDASLYWALRDARTAAREQERAVDRDDPWADREAALVAWREVKRLGILCLRERSKDFELAAWVTEALVRLDGLPGLRAGAELLSGLLDQYWESGFPRPDEEADEDARFEARLLPLDAMGGGSRGLSFDGLGTVLQPLRLLPLFRRADGSDVYLRDWNRAIRATYQSDSHRLWLLAKGVDDLAVLHVDAQADAETLRAFLADLTEARSAWGDVQDRAGERFMDQACGPREIVDALRQIQEEVRRALGPFAEVGSALIERRRRKEATTASVLANAVIDLPALLAPLGDDGGGLDLRIEHASLYWALRDARTAAREQERAFLDGHPDADRAASMAGWRDVKRLSILCLEKWSKDFEAAAWLTEALVRLDGLPGLAAGAELLSGLLDQYWDNGFPRADADAEHGAEFDNRRLPLEAMGDRSIGLGWGEGTIDQQLRLLPLFHRADGRPVLLSDWVAASDITFKHEEHRLLRIARGTDDLELLHARAQADTAPLHTLLDQLSVPSDALESLAAKAEVRFSLGSVGIHSIFYTLGSIQWAVGQALGPLADIGSRQWHANRSAELSDGAAHAPQGRSGDSA